MRKVRLPIKNLEELAAHSEYQAGVSSGGSTISLFRVSEQTYQSRYSFNIQIRVSEESKAINQEMLLTLTYNDSFNKCTELPQKRIVIPIIFQDDLKQRKF